MRRSQGGRAPAAAYFPAGHVEDENEQLADQLGDKIHTLKSLSIDIGHEVRLQDAELRGLDDGLEKSGGLLGTTRRRVMRLATSGNRRHLLYLFFFCAVVFLVLWLYLRSR